MVHLAMHGIAQLEAFGGMLAHVAQRIGAAAHTLQFVVLATMFLAGFGLHHTSCVRFQWHGVRELDGASFVHHAEAARIGALRHFGLRQAQPQATGLHPRHQFDALLGGDGQVQRLRGERATAHVDAQSIVHLDLALALAIGEDGARALGAHHQHAAEGAFAQDADA